MKLFKKDDSILDIVSKVISILIAIFGIYIYFHTIYPIFIKEHELKEVKDSLVKMNITYLKLKNEIQKSKEQISNYNSSITSLIEKLNLKNVELEEAKMILQDIQIKIKSVQKQATKAFLYKQVWDIIHIDNRQNPIFVGDFNMKQYAISIAKIQMNANDTSSAEYKANQLLYEFAKSHLNEQSHGNDLFKIFDYYAPFFNNK